MTPRLQPDLEDASSWAGMIERWLRDGTTLDLTASRSVDGERLSSFLRQLADEHNTSSLQKAADRNDGKVPGVDAAGLKVYGSVSLGAVRVTFPVSFVDTVFTGFVDCRGTEFVGDSDFRRAKFSRAADFSGAVFCGPVDFAKASFGHVADFRRTQFMQRVTFEATRFDMGDFNGARFRGPVNFERIDVARSLPGAPSEAGALRTPWTALAAVGAVGMLGLRLGSLSDTSKWLYLIGVAAAVALVLGWLVRPMIHRAIAHVRRHRAGRLDRVLRHSVVDGLLVAATALAAITVLSSVILDLTDQLPTRTAEDGEGPAPDENGSSARRTRSRGAGIIT